MKPSNFLRQIKEITEVTSAAPGHKLEDIDAINLQTPPRNRLLLPFSSKVILSDSSEVNEIEPSPNQFLKKGFGHPYEEVSPSLGTDSREVNEIEPSPNQYLKEDFSQPYEEATPSLGKEILFLQDCILANLAKKNEVEKSLDQPSKVSFMQPCEEGSVLSAKKRLFDPNPMEDNLAKNIKGEKSSDQGFKADVIQLCKEVSPSSAGKSLLNPGSSNDTDDSEESNNTKKEMFVSNIYVLKSNDDVSPKDEASSFASESNLQNNKLEESLGEDSKADSEQHHSNSDDSDDSDSGFYTQ